MAWGDKAAEQWEQDQSIVYVLGEQKLAPTVEEARELVRRFDEKYKVLPERKTDA